MLRNTFQHLYGIGSAREQELWGDGVLDWEAYGELTFPAPDLFSEAARAADTPGFRDGLDAFERDDWDWFAKRLSKPLYYRLALQIPEKVLFLDIETTGLGICDITMVGWAIGNQYRAWINGDDEDEMREVLQSAAVLVTFNGIDFDLPIMRSFFTELPEPAAHLDLMHFARRMGLRGGQKAIERQIGFDRFSHTEFDSGAAAPRLWSEYLGGDLESLRQLVAYNYADIEGMKAILDVVIGKAMDAQEVPLILRDVHRFGDDLAPLEFSEEPGGESIWIREWAG